MAFSDFKNTLEVAQKYGLRLQQNNFLVVKPKVLNEIFKEELAYSLKHKKPTPSEIAISENLISPMIRTVAKTHPHLLYWSREYYLEVDKDLVGTPDYLFSYTQYPDEISLGMPLVCVSEAKIDDFVKAWGQTLAEMVAIQKLGYDFPIFAWATNGITWEFAKLENNIFMQHSDSFSITKNTEEIAGILDWIFTESVRNAEDFLERNKK